MPPSGLCVLFTTTITTQRLAAAVKTGTDGSCLGSIYRPWTFPHWGLSSSAWAGTHSLSQLPVTSRMWWGSDGCGNGVVCAFLRVMIVVVDLYYGYFFFYSSLDWTFLYLFIFIDYHLMTLLFSIYILLVYQIGLFLSNLLPSWHWVLAL